MNNEFVKNELYISQENSCTLCEKRCGIDRRLHKGFCGESDILRCARASLHMWEEPCISSDTGSGTIFLTGCSLKCVYCQNQSISQGSFGIEVTVDRLSDIMLELQNKKAKNINFVTPTHFTLKLIEATYLARKKGLTIPIVWNTSSYESEDALRLIKDYSTVDIFLADAKYYDDDIAQRYSRCKNYLKTVKRNISLMKDMTGENTFDEDGVMKKGVIVRLLLLPGHLNDAKKVLTELFDSFENSIIYSLMSQFTPCSDLSDYPEIDRKITKEEYDEFVDYASMLGVENAYIQYDEAASESFIPEFDGYGITY